MRIVKKAVGKQPEVVDLNKEEAVSIFDSGMDKKKLYKSLYILDKYQRYKDDKTFNTSLIFPHTNIVNFYNDVYIMKKGMFGIKSLKRKEIDCILKLFKFDTSSIKKEKENKIKEENLEENND